MKPKNNIGALAILLLLILSSTVKGQADSVTVHREVLDICAEQIAENRVYRDQFSLMKNELNRLRLYSDTLVTSIREMRTEINRRELAFKNQIASLEQMLTQESQIRRRCEVTLEEVNKAWKKRMWIMGGVGAGIIGILTTIAIAK